MNQGSMFSQMIEATQVHYVRLCSFLGHEVDSVYMAVSAPTLDLSFSACVAFECWGAILVEGRLLDVVELCLQQGLAIGDIQSLLEPLARLPCKRRVMRSMCIAVTPAPRNSRHLK